MCIVIVFFSFTCFTYVFIVLMLSILLFFILWGPICTSTFVMLWNVISSLIDVIWSFADINIISFISYHFLNKVSLAIRFCWFPNPFMVICTVDFFMIHMSNWTFSHWDWEELEKNFLFCQCVAVKMSR